MAKTDVAETLAVDTQDVLSEVSLTIPNKRVSLDKKNSETEPNKPRLIITQMVLENFKSYAGRQVVGPFHRSFSAIVGPNGSGKSNVIDALLFVFGYRANKIRQGKLSELIHNSKNAGHVSQCTVEVHFKEIIDSEDGKVSEDIPGSELVVSRTAMQNNQSKYTINGATSSYTEVTKLLRGKGVDLDHKRFLILQGEVENISQMKSMGQSEGEVGLLEYLEDIIGTSEYKAQIEEAHKQVDDLNGIRAERLHRAKIVEKEKAGLEDKRNEAVEFIREENDLTRKRAVYNQKRLQENQAKVEELREQFATVQKEYDAERTRLASFKNENKTLEANMDLVSKECQVLESRAKKIKSQLAEFEREGVRLQVNRKHTAGKLKKARESGTKESQAAQQAKSTLATLEKDIELGQKEAADLSERLEAEKVILEEISEGLGGKTDGLAAAISQKQQELAPWREKIAAHESRLEIAQTELKVLDERQEAPGKQLEQAKAELRRLRDERVEKAAAAEARVDELAGINEKLEAADRERDETEAKLKEQRAAVVEARRREEDARAAVKSAQSQGAVLKGILSQRDQGKISGIYGRLGSLGTIDEKYDVAVSSSCGYALDSIVVQTVKSAQACVEYLRSSGIGRARFVILDTMREARQSGQPAPENVPRLVDLVRPAQDRFLPAFYHAMGETLVANDLDQARRVSKGSHRRRVVSLDGAVLEASGTMSGGGNRVSRGAMSARPAVPDATPEAVTRLAAAREAAELDCSELVDALRSTQIRRSALQKNYDELEAALPKIELELRAVDDQVQMAKQRARSLNEAPTEKPSEAETKRRAKINSQISAEQAAIAELQSQCAATEAEVRDLQEQIMQAGGIKLRAQRSKVDGLVERIATINSEISRWQVAQAKARKDLVRNERGAATREGTISELESQLAAVDEEIATATANAREMRESSEAISAKLEEKHNELETVKDELDANSATFSEMRATEAACKRRLDDTERSLGDALKSVNYWSAERERLVLHSTSGLDMTDEDDDKGDESTTLVDLSPDELAQVNMTSLKSDIEQAEARLQRTRPNLSVLTEYARRAAEYKRRSAELEEVTEQRDTAQKSMDDLRTRRLEEFMAGFSVISYKLKEMYQMITLGGNAELELVDSLDPFSEGIVFSVMPPKKSWKNIANLSGGEKTLSSLALVFALHQYKPTPLYVMDEIDAALDFRNISIVANYIKERTRNGQFIIISLRNNMFEMADRLVGIYKTDNRTKSIALDAQHSAFPLHSTKDLPTAVTSTSG